MLIAEGVFEPEEGASEQVLDLVCAEAPLDESQRAFLAGLGEAALRPWQVVGVRPGESFTLAPWPEGGEEAVIADKWSSRAFEEGDVLGLRLLETEAGLETSGAIYHFPPESLEELRRRMAQESEAPASLRMAHYWLELLAAHA